MAEEEGKHKEMYTKLLKKHGDGLEAEFDDEEAEYAELLVKTALTEKHESDKKKKYGDALRMAEQMERDTVLFVTQMMHMYPDVAKKEMKAILREEKKHLMQVRDRSQFLPTRLLGL
jgi:rubrerythrin